MFLHYCLQAEEFLYHNIVVIFCESIHDRIVSSLFCSIVKLAANVYFFPFRKKILLSKKFLEMPPFNDLFTLCFIAKISLRYQNCTENIGCRTATHGNQKIHGKTDLLCPEYRRVRRWG